MSRPIDPVAYDLWKLADPAYYRKPPLDAYDQDDEPEPEPCDGCGTYPCSCDARYQRRRGDR